MGATLTRRSSFRSSSGTRELYEVHADAAAPVLDGFMKLLRNAATWVPLYAFMIYWIIRYGKPHAWQFILVTIVCFAITDYVSASILKPWFARIRPCYDPELQPIMRGLVGCGGQYSLPSSHASNHFGLAAFWFWSINRMRGQKWHWLWLWAFAVCYAQVYVGKHYPLDVITGGIFGYTVGSLCAYFFDRWQFPVQRRQTYKPVAGFN